MGECRYVRRRKGEKDGSPVSPPSLPFEARGALAPTQPTNLEPKTERPCRRFLSLSPLVCSSYEQGSPHLCHASRESESGKRRRQKRCPLQEEEEEGGVCDCHGAQPRFAKIRERERICSSSSLWRKCPKVTVNAGGNPFYNRGEL